MERENDGSYKPIMMDESIESKVLRPVVATTDGTHTVRSPFPLVGFNRRKGLAIFIENNKKDIFDGSHY